MIDVIINCDNRQGYLSDKSTVGDFGPGSLQGVRSVDLLTEGIKNKMKFFEGYETRCVVYFDQHEELSDGLFMEITELVKSYGNNSKIIIAKHSKGKYRWNDHLYIEALKHSTGGYTAHFDMDCCAFKKEGFDIVKGYLELLDSGYKYICQSWDRIGDDMWWASTRFFICKTEILKEHLPIVENNLTTPFMGKHTPCVEHLLGALSGGGKVLYPAREDEHYIIFCWASYFSGLMKYLNELPYEKVKEYILNCGLYGTHDVLAKPIANE